MLERSRQHSTAIGSVLCISLLISGGSVTTVSANCQTDTNSRTVHFRTTDIYKSYTKQKGINFPLSRNTKYKTVDASSENIIMDEEKICNLKKLDRISQLNDGWNGGKAKAFDINLISKVRSIITTLQLQPELFPTACNSIQFEYEKEDGSYLEIELTPGDIWEVFEINKHEEEYFTISANAKDVIKVVNAFYE